MAQILKLQQATPLTVPPQWPVAGDVPDLTAIVQSQATTITEQAVLIDAYQNVLNNAQAAAPATATGTATGTSLTLTSVIGRIMLGAFVSGPGVPSNTTIVGQQSGTPTGNGTYTTNQATTASNSALTFIPSGGAMPWPPVSDAPTLTAIMQDQTAILRTQTALLQQYQDLLNTSNTPPPPTGP